MLNMWTLGGGQTYICPGMRHTAYCVMLSPLDARRPYSKTSGVGTWQGAGCQYRPRALGLRRGVAGDVVLLLVVV